MKFLLSLFDSSTATKWGAHISPRFLMQLSSRQAGDVWVAHVYEYILGYSMGYINFLPSCCFSLSCIFLKGSSQLFLFGLNLCHCYCQVIGWNTTGAGPSVPSHSSAWLMDLYHVLWHKCGPKHTAFQEKTKMLYQLQRLFMCYLFPKHSFPGSYSFTANFFHCLVWFSCHNNMNF